MLKLLQILLALLLLITGAQPAQVAIADFLTRPAYTNARLGANFIGLVLYLNESIGLLNGTGFQAYLLNSNLRSKWENNFMTTLRAPRGWYFECLPNGVAPASPACQKELRPNSTFWQQLGAFVINTQAQPFWAYGVNNDNINYLDPAARLSYFMYFLSIYQSTQYIFSFEAASQADQYASNGMRSPNYTAQSFISQALWYEQITRGIVWRAPGITEAASPDWISIMLSYLNLVNLSIFTFESTIFTGGAVPSISDLLEDNYTSGYIRRRAQVNASFSFSGFSDYRVAIANTHITAGDGIDGVTNVMAAGLWWLDFVVQCGMFGIRDVSIEGYMRPNNYQSVFGYNGTAYVPTALYYASLMAIYAVEGSPVILLPTVISLLSSRIKIYGLESTYLIKYLIINKDQNVSLDGDIILQVRVADSTHLECIYLSAPSLSSKADQMTLAGHSYLGGAPVAQGDLQKFYYPYDPNISGFAVRIKYAQAAVCELPNPNIIIPRKQTCNAQPMLTRLMVLFGVAVLLSL